jgi:hypothetical protein
MNFDNVFLFCVLQIKLHCNIFSFCPYVIEITFSTLILLRITARWNIDINYNREINEILMCYKAAADGCRWSVLCFNVADLCIITLTKLRGYGYTLCA